MNERIKELEVQCWEERKYGPPWFNSEKFAELIVLECVGICECEWNGDADTFAASEAYNECADAIKEHFGVQE
jgi:hypothetical protein